ncbi:MAG: SCO family protein [Actinomycetota bacterium]
MRRLTLMLVAVAMVAIGCGGSEPATLAGYELEPDPAVGTFALPAVNRGGEDFRFVADEGEILMVYFLFTNCPDFCPTTLADTRIALNELGARASEVDVAAVTIDPGRDTDEILTGYVESFIPDALALRTEDQTVLRETAFAFGADYRIVTDDAGEIEVGHTTSLFAVDDTGSLILTWPFGVTTDDIVNDLTILLDRTQAA